MEPKKSILEPFSNKLKIGTLVKLDIQNSKIIISESQNLIRSSQGAENVNFGAILK